jgi:hypothetical protein
LYYLQLIIPLSGYYRYDYKHNGQKVCKFFTQYVHNAQKREHTGAIEYSLANIRKAKELCVAVGQAWNYSLLLITGTQSSKFIRLYQLVAVLKISRGNTTIIY